MNRTIDNGNGTSVTNIAATFAFSHCVHIPKWLNTYCWLRMSSSQKPKYQFAAKIMQVAAPITTLCLVYDLSIMLIVERGEKITHYKHRVYLYDWLHNNSVTTFQSISRLFKVNSLRWLMSRYPQPSFPEFVRLFKFSANDNHALPVSISIWPQNPQTEMTPNFAKT